MALDPEVRRAVEEAKDILRKHGFECQTTAEDLVLWFQADTPFDADFGLDVIIKTPLLVVHELVEIEQAKKMGLVLTKDVIVNNLEKVDDAHMRAADVELRIAESDNNLRHLLARAENVRMWSEDDSVTQKNKQLYRDMYDRTRDAVARIHRTRRKGLTIFTVVTTMVTLDLAILEWLVPWADEHYVTQYMSMGYITTFLTVAVTFIVSVGLIAYYFQEESYASDRWR
jgi:hypothetical protein